MPSRPSKSEPELLEAHPRPFVGPIQPFLQRCRAKFVGVLAEDLMRQPLHAETPLGEISHHAHLALAPPKWPLC